MLTRGIMLRRRRIRPFVNEGVGRKRGLSKARERFGDWEYEGIPREIMEKITDEAKPLLLTARGYQIRGMLGIVEWIEVPTRSAIDKG